MPYFVMGDVVNSPTSPVGDVGDLHNRYTILYKEFMHKELRFDKQILEELFGVKFLSASFHVKMINCCRDMTPGQWKTSQMCQNVSEKYFTQVIRILPIFGL